MKRTAIARSSVPLARTGKPKVKRGTTTAALKRKATVLHSQYVRARDGACVRCGRSEGVQLQCAHIVGRTAAYTRTDENNAACLCAGCHHTLTHAPHEHVAFFTAYLGGWETYQALIDKAREGLGKTLREDFWQGEIERLSKLLEAL